MLSWFELAVLALATYRLSLLFAKEHGPGDVLDRFREWTGARQTINLGWTAETFWGKLMICPLCLSVWFAVLLFAVHLWLPGVRWAIQILAISGAASLFYLLSARD